MTQNLKSVYPSLPEHVKKRYRNIQRVVTLSSVLQYVIMEDLPKADIPLGNIKQRINRVHADIEAITKELHKRFMMPEASAASQDFTYGLYTCLNALMDKDEQELYEIGKELVK